MEVPHHCVKPETHIQRKIQDQGVCHAIEDVLEEITILFLIGLNPKVLEQRASVEYGDGKDAPNLPPLERIETMFANAHRNGHDDNAYAYKHLK